MRTRRGWWLVLMALLAAVWAPVAGCSSRPGEGGAPPSLFRPFVADPAESRVYYRDDESRHRITLHAGGRYMFETKSLYGDVVVARREGSWTWKTTGSHDARLNLDRDQWMLKFVSPDTAVAVNQSASGRTFAFHFERL